MGQGERVRRGHGHAAITTGPPQYDAASRTLSVAQLPNDEDTDPLSIYATALQAPDGGHASSVLTFFGTGSQEAPAWVGAADRVQLRPPLTSYYRGLLERI